MIAQSSSTSTNGSGAGAATHKTYPYDRRNQSCLYYIKTTEYKDGSTKDDELFVANFIPSIKTEIEEELGDRFYRIQLEFKNHSPVEFDISTDDFSDSRKLRAIMEQAGGVNVKVGARTSEHLSPATKSFTTNYQRIKRYNRTGWLKDKFLIPGLEPPNTEIKLVPDLPYEVDDKSNLQQGLLALDAFMESAPSEQITPLTSFMFQGPLAKLIGWENERYGMMILGTTGNFKTSSIQVLLQMYGEKFKEERYLLKWGDGATHNATMHLASYAGDLPFLIDNYKPGTGGGEKCFTALIHSLIEGADKKRLSKSSELNKTRQINAWPIVTGEDAPTNDPATIARLLLVNWQQNSPEKLAKAQSLAVNLPAVGKSWLTWLMSDEAKNIINQKTADFFIKRSAWMTFLKKQNKETPNVGRIATNLTTNELTWEILLYHPDIGPVLSKYKYITSLEELAKSMATITTQSIEAEKFLAYLSEIVRIENNGIYVTTSRSEEPIGYRDSTGYYFLGLRCVSEVLRYYGKGSLNFVSQQKLYEQLDNMGKIASKSTDGKTAVIKTFPLFTSQKRFLHLKTDALNI